MADDFDQQADDIINSVDQGTAAQIRNNAMIAAGVNHDQEAEYQHLAKFTNQPVDTVRALPDAAKQQAAAQTVPADQMAKTRPVTAQFFTDPNNARKAMDDAPTLSDLEGHVSHVGYVEGAFNDLGLNFDRLYEGARALYGNKFNITGMANDANDMLRALDEVEKTAVPVPDNLAGRVLYTGAKGFLNAVPILGATALTAGATGPITATLFAGSLMGAQQRLQSYGKYTARGATPEEADTASQIEGGIAGVSTALPFGYLADKLGKAGMGEFIGNFLARDFGAQAGQALATGAVDTAVANPHKTWTDYMKETPGEIGQSFVSAAMFAGVMAPIHSLSNRAAGNDVKVRQAQVGAQYVDTLDKMAAASTLRARDPEAFNKFMTEASDNGPVQDLYFNPKDLAQSGVDVNKIAALVPSVEQQLPNAIATGQDVKISVPEFATHIAGQDFAQNMIDHLKTDPDGFSKAQADQYMQTEGESLKSEVQKVLAEKQGDNAFKTSQQVVEDDLFKQLQATGRFTDDVTKPQAKLLSNFYAVQAARLGVTPEEFYNQHKVAIQAESPVSPGDLSEGSFGQDVKSPAFKRWFGGSKVVDENGDPLSVYHGTTHSFEEFNKENSNVENDLGAGFYFSNTPEDIEHNYAGEGPDLTGRIEGRAERMADDIQDEYEAQVKEVGEKKAIAGLKKKYGKDVYNEDTMEMARNIARKELSGGRPNTMPVHLAFKNPVELGGEHPTVLEMHQTIDEDTGDYLDEEPTGSLIDFADGLRQAAADYGVDGDSAVSALFEGAGHESITASDAVAQLKHNSDLMYAEDPDSGKLVGNEIIRRAFEYAGYDGIIDRTVNSKFGTESGRRSNAMKGMDESTVHYIAFHPKQVKSLFNKGTYDPNDPNILHQGEETRRGSFNPETNAITLFKAADLSTFFHESGHFFLETLNKIALDPNAPQEIKNDMQATLKWLGVKDLADWNSRDIEAKRDAHEQFARGFETFLFEGKSPNVEMQGIFSRFRAWLLNIYQSTENLRAELTPEMRGVFDRMLASTQQIKEAEAARAYEPFFKNQKEAGMNDQEWKAYQDLGINATLEAVNNLETRSLRDMRWSSNAKDRIIRGLQKSAKSKRNTVRREVTDAVMNEPVNRASTFLRFGTIGGEKLEGNHRLDVDALREMYGNEADAPWRQLENKYGKYGVMGKDGVHPDALAEQFGFTSGDELVKALIANENPRERIPAEIDRVMLEKYGDLTDPASLRRAADEAIHNEARTRFVVTEMNALQKAIGNKPILAKAAKSYAEDLIAKSKIRELIPSRYSSAETRSARAAEAARKEGDIKTAAIEKRNQLINSYATKATFDAQEEVEGIVKYMRKFDNPKLAKAITPGNFEQINALLERFDFKTKSLKAIDRAKSLTAWVEAQREDGIEPNIHPDILDEANRKNYKDMTVEELRGMNDAIKQIEHLGRLKNKLLTAQDNRTFAEATTTIANSIHEEAKGKVADNRTRAGLGDVKRTINDYLVSLRKSASLVRELDGFKDGGPMWEYFTRSANHAGDTEASMKTKAVVDINKIAREMLTREKMGGKGQYFNSVGMALNREERLGIALNMGNAGNIQRLLDGEGWKISQIEPIVKTLTKEDWKTIQDIWDYFESYRPQIGAKEKRVYGVEPEWVEPQPLSVQTRDGHTVELKGGYYPIKYDPRRSPQAEAHDAAELAKSQMAGAYTSATTRRSFTKSRVEEVTGRPLLYSLDGMFNGLNEVIHDLAWHEWGIDANRLLRNKSIDNAIRNRHGADVMLELKNHTRDMLSGDKQAADALGRIMSHFRKGSSISGLGFNIMNSMINMVGITQSMVRVGPGWVGRGLAHWANNPMDAIMDMRDQSTEMRLRFQTMNRELNEIKQQVRGKSTARQKFDTAMFTPMMMTQLVVDTPTWWGAKMKALSEGNDEARSIALADQAVLDAQGGGQIKDLASIQRGSEFKKLLTTFYGFFSTTYNLGVEATKKTNFKDPADVLRLGGDYLLLYTIPALMGTVIQSLIRNGFDEFDDMEKFGKKIAKDQVSFGMSTMPYVREFAGVGQAVTGNKPQDYNGPAGLRFIQQVDKLAAEAAQGKLDKGLFNAGVDVAGTALHIPSTQIRRTVDGVTAIMDGKTINPLAVVSGGPTKH